MGASVCYIYGLFDPRTGMLRYVGKTRDLERRLINHLVPARLKANSHKNAWLRGLLRDGYRPVIEALEETTPADWPSAERFWITYMRAIGCPLTNGNDGGIGAHNPTPETRAKTGAKRRGQQHSEEARAKMSASQKRRMQDPVEREKNAARLRANRPRTTTKGRNMTPEQRQRISEAQMGRVLSAEHRAKISAANKGRKPTPEAVERGRQANLGRRATPETRAKQSAAHAGKPFSEEHKANLAEALRRAWARRKVVLESLDEQTSLF